MTDLEIPHEKDRRGWYRFFEMLPGIVSWCMLILPFALSLIDVRLAAFFILIFLLINFTRGIAGATRSMQGFRRLKEHQKLPWRHMLTEITDGKIDPRAKRPIWHEKVVARLADQPVFIRPDQVIHAVIIAVYKESRDIIEPTIQSIINSDYDMKQVVLVIAYEERAGEATDKLVHELTHEYKKTFFDMLAIGHPRDIPGEVIGKGGNITYAGRQLKTYLENKSIDPERVMVTTLDADNRPDKNYLAALSYVYAVAPDPLNASYQPVSLYTNNIWDAPAPSRVIATGNSIFNLTISLRPHALRNFSSHAQPMAALLKTDFWSVRTIVEDGHQFWRSYFALEGKYRVLPLHIPIYQDAVLSESLLKTLKAQFVQLRRWTYGASDVAYVIHKGFFTKNNISKVDVFAKAWRLFEGHITWAVGAILVLFGGFIPSLFTDESYTAVELPIVVSRIQTVALIMLLSMLFLAMRTLPPKPLRYRNHRTIFMVLQWVYLPFTTIIYNSFAALNSQTRLIFGKYLSKFDVTEKAVVKQVGGKKVTRA